MTVKFQTELLIIFNSGAQMGVKMNIDKSILIKQYQEAVRNEHHFYLIDADGEESYINPAQISTIIFRVPRPEELILKPDPIVRLQ